MVIVAMGSKHGSSRTEVVTNAGKCDGMTPIVGARVDAGGRVGAIIGLGVGDGVRIGNGEEDGLVICWVPMMHKI